MSFTYEQWLKEYNENRPVEPYCIESENTEMYAAIADYAERNLKNAFLAGQRAEQLKRKYVCIFRYKKDNSIKNIQIATEAKAVKYYGSIQQMIQEIDKRNANKKCDIKTEFIENAALFDVVEFFKRKGIAAIKKIQALQERPEQLTELADELIHFMVPFCCDYMSDTEEY